MGSMNEIKTLFNQFEEASFEYEGVECWSARELQVLLGYDTWRRFENALEKAQESCQNAGHDKDYHFAGSGKMIPLGKGAEREVKDYYLTRYACYNKIKRGVKLENLPAEEDIKKVERKIKKEEKKKLKK